MDIFDIPVHPAADVFPMLAEDELAELAADIQANGVLHPLAVQEIGGVLTLIDGRNRREACRIASVVPDYTLLDGQDPVAYILSTNINRRHMSKGQRAMAVAMIYPEAKRGRGNKDEAKSAGSGDIATPQRIREARTVLRHTPDAAALVRSGAMSLDGAYEKARNVKLAAEGEEGVMRSLRAEAPDLADQVAEETKAMPMDGHAWRAEQLSWKSSVFGCTLCPRCIGLEHRIQNR